VPSSSTIPFRNAAVVSELITNHDLLRAEDAVREELEIDQPTDEQIADKLVEWDVVTSYQAEQLRAGRTKFFLGPYIVTDWIGQGGMGQVYKAVHKMMGRESAVKVLPLNKATDDAVQNFMREIQTQAKLDHEYLVRAFDAGQEGKVYYLVTEYVPGENLRQLVRTQGPLSMQQSASVIHQAALGLDYAHKQALIHRDVKPGNVLVTPEGVAKVSDLGLAGFLHETDNDPRAGKVVGTADYLSPEQIRTPNDITPVSDIYSLGCTLYYAVSGKVPYPGGSAREKARRHCEGTPMHPRRFNTEISEEFVEVIADMMEKDPEKRVQSAEEVAARLEPWIGDAPVLSQQLTKSPWMPPPLPAGLYDDDDQDTDAEEVDSVSQSQGSLSTNSFAAANQETTSSKSRRRPKPPPLSLVDPPPEVMSRGVAVAIALAVAIPVSMFIGAVLSMLFMTMFGSR
jgi:serine/threonine protein kinase